MAESQLEYRYDAPALAALRRTISAPRFDPYMAMATNDERHAFGLYLYNARLAKAFLFPLQMVEIVLRNAVVEALAGSFGTHWPDNPAFQAWLQVGGRQAIAKANERLIAEKGAGYPVSQLVSTLTFDFWSNMLRDEYERPFWQKHFRRVLPHVPVGTLRRHVQKKVKEICHFRNRVVHHEPILNLNAPAVLDEIIEVIGLRCPVTAEWTKHHCTVGSMIGTKPAARSLPPGGRSGWFAMGRSRRSVPKRTYPLHYRSSEARCPPSSSWTPMVRRSVSYAMGTFLRTLLPLQRLRRGYYC